MTNILGTSQDMKLNVSNQTHIAPQKETKNTTTKSIKIMKEEDHEIITLITIYG